MPALASAIHSTAADEARLKELRAHVRREAEDRPGVYRMITETGEVAYVGKAKDIRKRLLSYFRAEFPKEKGARIVREAASIEWTYVPSEFASLLEEMRQIKALRPRLNVALKRDGRNLAFVRITSGRAPRLAVLRSVGASQAGGVSYGPFHGATQLRESLRELADALGIRDCTLDNKMRFADQPDLIPLPPRTPGCIRFEIGTCLGPCVAAPTATDYLARVAMARAFLEGESDEPIERLRAEMQQFSERMEYERAAKLRDRALRLEGLRDQLDRLRFAVESLTFAYHVPGHGGDDRVYLIRRGVIREQRDAPKTPADHRELATAMRSVSAARTFRASTVVPSHEVDELMLVSSWFANRPDELARTISFAPEDPQTAGT